MNPEKTTNNAVLQHDLTQVLDYAENTDKTDHFCYVTGINCIPETVAEHMTMMKLRFGKTGGNMAFHAYQNFQPGEGTAAQCHKIGVELARKLWRGRFEVVVITHLNTNCLHNHFVLNCVSFMDGKRYNDYKTTYWEFRRLSDEICREYGLSVVENPQKSKTPRSLYLAEKAGLSTPVLTSCGRTSTMPLADPLPSGFLSGASANGISGALRFPMQVQHAANPRHQTSGAF